ncbi:MarR family winged helix-turn-helix transcriptional regulator [Raoultibacter phocaeensis]|uniref:MarR family winged helix-turn-helix transcriptional regulator n=1 Tax=Raoultibacter phocaeensis TaxID=2479841 RepID=UPI00111AE17B|nr:hypothetical protein [Raoultibacter phocaeensis]
MKDSDHVSEYSPDYLMLRMLVGFGNKLGTIDRMTFRELTGRQCTLIASIGSFEEPPTLGQLAECEGSSHQNIKQMALKLQEKGYVKLLSDSSDARKIRVTATKKGHEFCKKHHEAEVKFLERLFQNVNEKEVANVSKVMSKLNENLDSMVCDGLKLE